MIVIVPAATATGVTLNNHVVVPLDVDVVDAGVADIVGPHIGLAVVDRLRLGLRQPDGVAFVLGGGDEYVRVRAAVKVVNPNAQEGTLPNGFTYQ